MPTRMEITLGGRGWAGGGMAPWTGGSRMPMASKGACPTGNCTTAYGPVANICQSTMPVTRMVPVTEQIPITTVMPIPNTVMPGTTMGAPMGATMGMPVGGMAPWGKGAMVPGMMPGIYTTEAWIAGV